MSSPPSTEPDGPGAVIRVGRDEAGHWLVQDAARTLEGRFVSFDAALRFARGERASHRGRLEVVGEPLRPCVPFAPLGPWERAA